MDFGGREMKSILIVDDRATVRLALRHFFRSRMDWSVLGEAIDGTEAILKAVRLKPDLVLMDLAMPNLSGVRAAASIRERLPNVRILLFTLYSNVLRRDLADVLGVDIIIDKSSGVTGLIRALESILAIQNPIEAPPILQVSPQNVRVRSGDAGSICLPSL